MTSLYKNLRLREFRQLGQHHTINEEAGILTQDPMALKPSPARCPTLQNSLVTEHRLSCPPRWLTTSPSSQIHSLKPTPSALPGTSRRSLCMGAGENCTYMDRLEPAGLCYLRTDPNAHLWECYHQAALSQRGREHVEPRRGGRARGWTPFGPLLLWPPPGADNLLGDSSGRAVRHGGQKLLLQPAFDPTSKLHWVWAAGRSGVRVT